MKKILRVTATLFALGAAVDAMATPIQPNLVYAPAIGHIATAGQQFPIGSYVYTGNPTGNAGGGFEYIAPGSIYAAGDPTQLSSSAIIEAPVTRVVTDAHMDLVSARIAERHHGQKSGQLALNVSTTDADKGGNAGSPWANRFTTTLKGGNGGSIKDRLSFFLNANWKNIKDTTSNFNWDANLYSGMLGADYKFNSVFLAGLALTYSYMDGNTPYNRGKIKDNAFGVLPFVSAKFTKWFAMDAMFSYSWVRKSRDRVNPHTGLAIGVPHNVTGSPKSDRWFAAIFANLTHEINKFRLLGRLGFSHAEDRQKAFSESDGTRYGKLDTKLNRLHVRLQAGYEVTKEFDPYLFGLYNYDFSQTRTNLPLLRPVGNAANVLGSQLPKGIDQERSQHTWGGGLGFNYKPHQNWVTGLEYGYSQNKKLKVHSVNLHIRYKF
jgi:opacity protein-like surface antigen